MAKSKKHHKMEFTPIMMLSMLALFVMMPTIFFVANTQKETTISKAAYYNRATPTPTPEPLETEPLEENVYRVYN